MAVVSMFFSQLKYARVFQKPIQNYGVTEMENFRNSF